MKQEFSRQQAATLAEKEKKEKEVGEAAMLVTSVLEIETTETTPPIVTTTPGGEGEGASLIFLDFLIS